MRSIKTMFSLVVLTLCVGCSIPSSSTPEPMNVTQTSKPESVGPVGPFEAEWEFVDMPVLATDNLHIAVYAIGLDGQNTIVIYSATGSEAINFPESSTAIQIRDNSGSIVELISTTPLAYLDQIYFGIMRFEPRPIGASELYLQLNQDSDEAGILDVLIARLSEQPENPSTYNIRTCLLNTGETLEQNEYHIMFTGWIAPPSSVKITPNSSESSIARRKATLQLENIDENLIYYLFIQFHSNWEATGTIIKK